MAKSFGTLTVSGHVGRAFYKEGNGDKKAFAKLSVAVFNGLAKGDSPDDEKTIWVNVLVFGYEADSLRKENINKGDFVCASGPLSMEFWKRDDGEAVEDIAIIARSISFMKKAGSGDGQAARDTERKADRAPIEDDEIPF